MEDLFNQYAKSSTVEEANRFRTVKKGSYTIQPTKVDAKVTKKDENDPTKPQRPYAHITASVLDPEGKKVATLFFNASWIEGRTLKTGRLDGMCKLWGNIEKAYDVIGKSAGEVIQTMTKYPCKAYVDVVYRDPAGQNYYVKSNTGVSEEDQEKQYLIAGYEPSNTVLNISKVA